MDAPVTAVQNLYVEYEETDAFYTNLDELIKGKNAVIIRGVDRQLDSRSKLMTRIQQCVHLDDLSATPTLAAGALACSATIFPVVPALIAYVSTLLTGLIGYSIYKGYGFRVKTSVNGADSEPVSLEVELVPPKS
ncbi:hypothetical protein [Aeromonas salmonicida]|uniref:hypothetical protein n=1 Tax=Aeromonas salmonicida TaxID=645 RepID=UPI00259DF692|nr:hypothetical protein [Aeromonas salmonicida]MDM5150215.1 hypothetical protein [Aeromonas salmonicida]